MKVCFTAVLLSLLTAPCLAQTGSVYFADHPTPSPDGALIVFSYDGDLWQVPAAGGAASRITAMEGAESHPRISPDGKWLAFAGNQYGNADVYVMPMGGGAIRQLTFHEGNDQPSGWDWDSQTIFFESPRSNRVSTYAITVGGGTPRRLFGHYFNNVHNVARHPQTGAYFFNESWESNNFSNRKGYVGAYNPDLKSYDPQTGAFTRHTDHEGKDFWATIDRAGNIYYVSDAYNGEYNLYRLGEGDRPERLTRFTASVKHPQVSADGSRIVFQKDYQLFIYDTRSKRSEAVRIDLARNSVLARSMDFNTKGNITGFDVSGDGKKFAFVSRGELFVSDTEGKFVRQIPTRPDGRVTEVYWLKDDRSLIYNQTVGGYLNWFSTAADGSTAEVQWTNDPRNNRNLHFNSDRTRAVYTSGRDQLRLLDLESKASETIFTDEFWGFQDDQAYFGPDDRTILYTARRNFEKDMFLYDIIDRKTTPVMPTAVSEDGPVWAPDGKHIYFTSDLLNPSYPRGPQDQNIYRVALTRDDGPYRSEEFDKLFAEKEKEKKDTSASQEPKPALEADLYRIEDRVEAVGPRFGTQAVSTVLQDKGKTMVLFLSNHDEGQYKLWKTTFEDFERPNTEEIKGGNRVGSAIRHAKGKYYLLAGGNISELNLGGNAIKPITIDFTFRRSLQDEFAQMFYETWANLEENFYNETFHGVDWDAKRDQYARFLPYVNNRADLRLMTNDMLGELNTSHFGFRSSGPEEELYYGTRTLATGILFTDEEPYTVSRIVTGSPADFPAKAIQAGDVLTHVNGQVVDPAMNREYYFARPSRDEELSLTFRRGEESHTVKLKPTSYGSISNLLYNEWEDACQETVDRESGKRIAYVHMKNMGGGELDRFLRDMATEGYQRDALILDLRWNTGGNVHDDVLRFLSRRTYLKWKYREGAFTTQGNFGPSDKPIVLLINEQSLSDAEMTAAGFRELGLGTIVGTETYRWIIFTSGKGLVDGSFYRLPSWGCYTFGGDNLERTGVAPDVFVAETFKDRLEGKDPQLEKALEILMEQMK